MLSFSLPPPKYLLQPLQITFSKVGVNRTLSVSFQTLLCGANGLPKPTKQHMKARKAKSGSISIRDNQVTIKHSTINFGTIVNESGSSSGNGQKRPPNDEEQPVTEDSDVHLNKKEKHSDDEAPSLWKDCVRFLENEENIKKFHPFSPEFHNVLRFGRGVSPKPNLDIELYRRLLQSHIDSTFELPKFVSSYIYNIIDSENMAGFEKAIRTKPKYEDEQQQNLYNFLEKLFDACHVFYSTRQKLQSRESVFNDFFIYPFLKQIASVNAKCIKDCDSEFVVGETPLESMARQLNDSSESKVYLADGIMKLFGIKGLEILLLETSHGFGSTDSAKISFDHHKGLFGTLSMIKTVADQFYYGSVEAFARVKIFFLQGAGKSLYLWSLRYNKEGPFYELWLEGILDLNANFEERIEVLPALMNFFWMMKNLVEESTANIAALRDEHLEMLKRSRSAPPPPNLSIIVNPTIMRLTEEDDKKGLQTIGPFFNR